MRVDPPDAGTRKAVSLDKNENFIVLGERNLG